MTGWETFSVIVKFWNLVSMATVIGGGFCFYLFSRQGWEISRAHLMYIFIGAASGLVSTTLFFLIQVGGINQSGLTGAFDLTMATILLDTSLGSSSLLRISGYLIALLIVTLLLLPGKETDGHPRNQQRILLLSGLAVATLTLGISFALAGHTVELGIIVRTAIVLHVLAALTWVGSLYPLIGLPDRQEITGIKILMIAFGNWMIPVLLMLLVTGAFLAVSLVQFPGELFTTRYGISLFIKMALVICIVLIGASNKFQLVPYLDSAGTRSTLQTSIFAEMILAILIISVTSYFTTVIGVEGA